MNLILFQSCSCEGACNTSDCKCVQANGDCVYDENGHLKPDFDYFSEYF